MVKLMAYDEEDYAKIMETVKYCTEVTFTDTDPVTHLPYSKGGLKFTMLGMKVTEGELGTANDSGLPLLEPGRKRNLADQILQFESEFPNSKRAFMKHCPTGGEATMAVAPGHAPRS